MDTEILSRRDAHRDKYRPAVVVGVVESIRLVQIYTRTTDVSEAGVRHPATHELQLYKDGVFGRRWYQSVDLGLFRHPLVVRLGLLDDVTWSRIQQMWEDS